MKKAKTPEELAAAVEALKVAATEIVTEAPVRLGRFGGNYLSAYSIRQVRDALDVLGVDWRGIKKRQEGTA